jgi:hypothetical protein
MAEAARSIARPDAADTIATDILSLIDRPTTA